MIFASFQTSIIKKFNRVASENAVITPLFFCYMKPRKAYLILEPSEEMRTVDKITGTIFQTESSEGT